MGLFEQFADEHPWWDEYAEAEGERERKRALFDFLDERAAAMEEAREAAIERIGWTGGPDA